MPNVIVRKAKYDYTTLKPIVFEILDSVNGGSVQKGAHVLIKPNLLISAPPAAAILTHPLILRAAVEYVLSKGAFPQVSDSPAIGSFDKILKESGIKEALNGLNVECRGFSSSVAIDVGPPFNKIEIANDVIEADAVINLPKLKTHSQMLLTLGAKNLFGCIVGFRKPEWHLRTGIDREMFARLLVHIYKSVRPSLTILDGILAMEGQGPGKSGIPKELGVIMGSSDALAVDFTVCKMFGLEPQRLLTNKIAEEMNLLNRDSIEIDGELPDVRNFRLPEITPLIFGPKKLHGLMRRHLIQKPVSDSSICKLCGECVRFCPAKAITNEQNKINFDYDKCIRCYCCIEICPHGALSSHETPYGRILRKIIK